MGRHAKSQRIIDEAVAILAENAPMTVRQVYYQLVSRQVIENSRTEYQAVSNALVAARKEGIIPWEAIDDRLRRPRQVDMWDDLPDFVNTVQAAYHRDVWATQPTYVECWLEKDALSGVLEDALRPYGVLLNVGRGYDGWTSIHNAAERYTGRETTVLYLGDFDPSGEDMVRSLRDRLAELGVSPAILKVGLTEDDIDHYHLPPNLTKKTDTRQKAFVGRFGDKSVELDALPVSVLRSRVVQEVEQRMDLQALAAVQEQEARERQQLIAVLSKI